MIPAGVRRQVGIAPGDLLLLRTQDGQVILETRANVERRMRGRFAHIPESVSLSDELVVERRAEALRELAGG